LQLGDSHIRVQPVRLDRRDCPGARLPLDGQHTERPAPAGVYSLSRFSDRILGRHYPQSKGQRTPVIRRFRSFVQIFFASRKAGLDRKDANLTLHFKDLLTIVTRVPCGLYGFGFYVQLIRVICG
jgi:hypothetical protein